MHQGNLTDVPLPCVTDTPDAHCLAQYACTQTSLLDDETSNNPEQADPPCLYSVFTFVGD